MPANPFDMYFKFKTQFQYKGCIDIFEKKNNPFDTLLSSMRGFLILKGSEDEEPRITLLESIGSTLPQMILNICESIFQIEIPLNRNLL